MWDRPRHRRHPRLPYRKFPSTNLSTSVRGNLKKKHAVNRNQASADIVLHRMARITIVEDALDDAEVFDILLTSAGHEVQRFSRGTEFLESFQKGTMDLILLDIGLPEVDGYEVF